MTPSIKSTASSVHLRNKVCRLCLEEQEKLAELVNLFFDNIRFLDILKECLGIEINPSQGHLPLLICQRCLVTTLNFQNFKTNVMENEVFLQNVNLDDLNKRLHASCNEINLDDNSRHSGSAALSEDDYEGRNEDSSVAFSSQSGVSEYQSSSIGTASLKTNPDYQQLLDKSNPEDARQTAPLVENHVEEKINFFESKNVPVTTPIGMERIDDKANPSISSESSGYACSICSSFFTDQKYINQPMCKNCTQAKGKRRILVKPTSGKVYACNTCKQRFEKARDWKEHMISHYATHMYHCLQCSSSFDSKHELIVHTYSHLYLKTEARRKKDQLGKRQHNKIDNKNYSKIF